MPCITVAHGGTSKRATAAGLALVTLFAIGAASDRRSPQDETPAAGSGNAGGPAPVPRAAPDTPEAPASAGTADTAARIAALLEAARTDIEAERFTTPPGRNAVEKLRRVLAHAPDNADARRALRDIVERYVELGRDAAKRGDLDTTERYLERALAIAPKNAPRLQRLRERLEKAKRSRQ